MSLDLKSIAATSRSNLDIEPIGKNMEIKVNDSSMMAVTLVYARSSRRDYKIGSDFDLLIEETDD